LVVVQEVQLIKPGLLVGMAVVVDMPQRGALELMVGMGRQVLQPVVAGVAVRVQMGVLPPPLLGMDYRKILRELYNITVEVVAVAVLEGLVYIPVELVGLGVVVLV
jgi:hypothetical protein